MKVKLTKEQIRAIISNPAEAEKAGVKASDAWWVIVLKVIAYAIGLILGGAVTASCASAAGLI